MGEPLPCGSHPQPKGDEEEGSPVGDEDMQVNNRVAGGAGKRLSVEDLQVQTNRYCTLPAPQSKCSPGSACQMPLLFA